MRGGGGRKTSPGKKKKKIKKSTTDKKGGVMGSRGLASDAPEKELGPKGKSSIGRKNPRSREDRTSNHSDRKRGRAKNYVLRGGNLQRETGGLGERISLGEAGARRHEKKEITGQRIIQYGGSSTAFKLKRGFGCGR